MEKMDVKANEVVAMYKKLLAPYGFTLVPIKTMQDEKIWEPANKKEFEGMSVIQINEYISNINIEKANIDKLILETKDKVLKVMETVPNNETLAKLYTNTYSKDMFDRNLVRIESEKYAELSKTVSYLTLLRSKKRIEDLNKRIKGDVSSVASVEIAEDNGTKVLKIKLK
jgi:hypothetical protein